MIKRKVKQYTFILLGIVLVFSLYSMKNDILFTYYLDKATTHEEHESYYEASKYYNKILNLEGYENTYGVLLNKAGIDGILGYYNDALDGYQLCLNIKKDDPRVYYSCGLANFLKNDFESSKDMLEKSVVLDSEYYQSYELLGDIAVLDNNPTLAIEWYNKYLEYNSSNNEITEKLKGLVANEFKD